MFRRLRRSAKSTTRSEIISGIVEQAIGRGGRFEKDGLWFYNKYPFVHLHIYDDGPNEIVEVSRKEDSAMKKVTTNAQLKKLFVDLYFLGV